MIAKEKLDWFNSLPLTCRAGEGDRYQRTCPCGSTVWYEGESLSVYSWIDLHINHKAKAAETEIVDDLYDWTKPIRFSNAGFVAFVVERKISVKFRKELSNGRALFIDNTGTRFVFKEIETKDAYSEIAFIYDPYLSGTAKEK